MDEERNYSHNTAITLFSNFYSENPKLLGLFILACIQEQSITSQKNTFSSCFSNQDYLDCTPVQSNQTNSYYDASQQYNQTRMNSASMMPPKDIFPLYLSHQDYLELAQFQSKPINSNNKIQSVDTIQHYQNNDQVRKKNSRVQATKSNKNRYMPYPGEGQTPLFPILGKSGKLAKGEVLMSFNELNNHDKERTRKKKEASSVSTAPQCFFPETIRKNQDKKRIESENSPKNKRHSKIEKKSYSTPQKH